MKKLIVFLAFIALGCALWYGFTAFIIMKADVTLWHWTERLMMAIFGPLIGAILWLIYKER